MNIRQLQHFLALMETGSLSAASDAVHLSQPAFSRSIKALEDELGVLLFDRTNRRLKPTPFALEYLERAKRMVFDEREGIRTLALMKNGAYGPLSFGMGPSVAIDLLAPLIQELLDKGPGLRINAQVQTTEALLEGLHKERLDFYVGDIGFVASSEQYSVEPLYACDFGWFARKDHPLAQKPSVKIEDIKQFPILGYGHVSDVLGLNMAQLYGLSLPVEKNFAANINSVEVVHKIVKSSDAIAPSTYFSMMRPLEDDFVRALNVQPRLELNMTLGIVTLAHRTLAPAAFEAFKIIRLYFEDIATKLARYS